METDTHNERADARPAIRATPRVDVWRRDGVVQIEVELPGVKPSAVSLRDESGALVIEATRNAGEADVRYLRRLRLGDDLDTERAEARHEHGVLTVTIPPREVTVRNISVESA
jgi:HSP20 family protein